MRVELPDGQYAEVRERITHAQDKAIRRARRRARESLEETWDDLTVALQAFVRGGHIRDVDGELLDLVPGDDRMLPWAVAEAIPKDIVDTLGEVVLTLYLGATVPNAPTPPSSAGSSSG